MNKLEIQHWPPVGRGVRYARMAATCVSIAAENGVAVQCLLTARSYITEYVIKKGRKDL